MGDRGLPGSEPGSRAGWRSGVRKPRWLAAGLGRSGCFAARDQASRPSLRPGWRPAASSQQRGSVAAAAGAGPQAPAEIMTISIPSSRAGGAGQSFTRAATWARETLAKLANLTTASKQTAQTLVLVPRPGCAAAGGWLRPEPSFTTPTAKRRAGGITSCQRLPARADQPACWIGLAPGPPSGARRAERLLGGEPSGEPFTRKIAGDLASRPGSAPHRWGGREVPPRWILKSAPGWPPPRWPGSRRGLCAGSSAGL